jgi:hypothetical protein
MIDQDWPILKKTFEAWLSADNFDKNGRQKKRLQEIRKIIN